MRFLQYCGMPLTDIELLHSDRTTANEVISDSYKQDAMRILLFTGSSEAARHITNIVGGRVRLEDAGFDWKILGPDGDSFTDTEID